MLLSTIILSVLVGILILTNIWTAYKVVELSDELDEIHSTNAHILNTVNEIQHDITFPILD